MTGPPLDSLATLLRRHRAVAGLTQEELAERAGMSARTVSDIERGMRQRIYRFTAGSLAEALRLLPEDRVTFETAARGRRSVAGEVPSEHPAAAAPTPLLGRQRELALVLAGVGAPGTRLTTITGTGGIGKTRLALEVAARAEDLFEDGVVVVSLGVASDPTLLPSIIAGALGMVVAGDAPGAALREHLRERHLLLVLDTFEHVLPAAPLVAELLAGCPRLSVLATSRAPLRLRGEREVPLPPLELPGETGGAATAAALVLFAERAQAVRPGFVLDAATTPAVARICRRLGGLPLAIELAAARLRHLPLRDLDDNLGGSLELLSGGPVDLPRRQRTMRDTIGWSHALLEPPERDLMSRLSIFAGGWSLADAAAICSPRGSQAGLLAPMSALVDQSLIQLAGAAREQARYEMLDVIREYAAERLAGSGEAESLRRRHAERFLALAEAAEPELGGAAQTEAFRRLDTDRDNLRAALGWCLATREAEMALRLAGALWQFWRRRGDLTEARLWLDRALSLDGRHSFPPQAKALWGAAWLAYHQGDQRSARRLGEELLDLARQQDAALHIRNGLTVVGMVSLAEGADSEAVARLTESLSLARAGPGWLLAASLMNLGVALLHAGDLDRSQQLLEEARAQYETIGDRVFTARVGVHLGQAALLRGEADAARTLFGGSLTAFRQTGEAMGIAEALEGLSAVQAGGGDIDGAAQLAGAAAAAREAAGIRPHPFDRRLIDRHLEAAGIERDGERWQAGVEAGATLDLDDATAAVPGLSSPGRWETRPA